MAGNKIRIKQLEQTELSGYISEVYVGTISGKATDLNPAQSGIYDLGKENLPWKIVYADSIHLSGSDAPIENVYPATGNLLPIKALEYALGSPSIPWESLYVGQSGIYIDGNRISVKDNVITITKEGSSTEVKMAQGPQGERGGFGGDSVLYNYDHQTGVSQSYPSVGYLTFNTGEHFDKIDTLYIHDSGYYSQQGNTDLVNNVPWVLDLVNSTSDIKGTLRFFKHENPSKFSSYHITGSLTNEGTYFTVPLSYINSSESNNLITGAFKDEDKIVASFVSKGDIGQIGPQGPSDGPQGAQGLIGPQGPQGIQGPTGPAGGPQGPQGESIYWSGIWNSQITYDKLSTVSHGSSSFISKSGTNKGNEPLGTSNDLYWGLMSSGMLGPQGPQGPEGGPPGYTGPQGTSGPQGPTGPAGAMGIVSGHAESVRKTIQQTDFWVGENAFGIIDAVRFNGSEYVKSRANSQENAEVMGVVESLNTGNNSFTIVSEGFVNWPTGLMQDSPFANNIVGEAKFSPGKVYWLDDSVAGLLTTGEPNTVGSVSKPLFFATSTSGGFVQNYRGQVIDSGIGPKFIIPGIGDVTRHGQQVLTSKKLSLQTSFGVKALSHNANMSIDFDDEPFQVLDILGNTIINTINGGIGKTITVKMINSASVDFALVFGSNNDQPKFVGALKPTELKAGKIALVSFTSFGPDQSDVVIAFADEK